MEGKKNRRDTSGGRIGAARAGEGGKVEDGREPGKKRGKGIKGKERGKEKGRGHA